MTALYIILGIAAFFILIFSVPLHVSFEYTDYIYLSVRWLFIKINILPLSPKKKEKKEKKPKKDKPEKKKKKKKPEPEKKPEEKKENPILVTVRNMGYDGVMAILSNLGKALGGMFKRLFKAFRVEHFAVRLTVGKGDAAETAVEYGKTCGRVFPVCGLMCSTMRVKTYDVEVSPDFLANRNTGEFEAEFYFVPQRFIHAFFIVGIELVFKVLLKFFLTGNKKNSVNNQSEGAKQKPEA